MPALIDDETHPQMLAAQRELVARLGFVTLGRPASREMFANLIMIRDDHRAKWRSRGVDFPHMVFFIVPRLGLLELWRADLDERSVRTKLLNVTMSYPTVTPRELSVALRAAYPQAPGAVSAVVDEGEAMIRRIAERAVQ